MSQILCNNSFQKVFFDFFSETRNDGKWKSVFSAAILKRKKKIFFFLLKFVCLYSVHIYGVAFIEKFMWESGLVSFYKGVQGTLCRQVLIFMCTLYSSAKL
jgi:hypothetical protein